MESIRAWIGDGVMAVRDVVQAAAGAGGDKLYVDDVFSTYLYAGNGSTQTINNGIDLDGEGGLVWVKTRDLAYSNALVDTETGAQKLLRSDMTSGQVAYTSGLTAFNSNGFTLGGATLVNSSGINRASWTFRKAPKCFDIVQWTGDDTTNRTHAHNLGSVPGLIIVKATSRSSNWTCYHRSLGNTKGLSLNSTDAAYNSTAWNSTSPTDSVFTATSGAVNEGGETYVAYLFAHDAGGFGDDGEQNIISCGSVVGASQQEVYLGFEPQWILLKNADSAQDWWMVDNMRGWPVQGTDTSYSAKRLNANLSSAESTLSIAPSATGFKANTMTAGQTYIYIAIRRPMKAPEAGTEVFTTSTSGPGVSITAGFVPDFSISQQRNNGAGSGSPPYAGTRLQGNSKQLNMTSTAVEGGFGYAWDAPTNTWVQSSIGTTLANQLFKRAPGFMDVVCDTGTGSNKTEAHNLGVVPELIIRKSRSYSGAYWLVGSTYLSFSNDEYLQLSTTGSTQVGGGSYWNSTAPTSSVFSVGSNSYSNGTNHTFINYLFATLAGVSKVGLYTGTGAAVNVDCGFSAGARFILIKRTDSTGDWYYWDSVRGVIAGNDPYMRLNSTAAEVTNTDYIDPLASGFTVTSSAPAALNASGGTYIFLAIA